MNTTLGGLASVAGGDKFANGAVTSAFGYLANNLGGSATSLRGNTGGDNAYVPPAGTQVGCLEDLCVGEILFALEAGMAAKELTQAVYDKLYKSPTDRYADILDESHLDAAQRELQGETVATKWDETPYDHVTEVLNAQQGLLNRIGSINSQLGNPNMSASQRLILQDELGRASRLLDYSERYVPR